MCWWRPGASDVGSVHGRGETLEGRVGRQVGLQRNVGGGGLDDEAAGGIGYAGLDDRLTRSALDPARLREQWFFLRVGGHIEVDLCADAGGSAGGRAIPRRVYRQVAAACSVNETRPGPVENSPIVENGVRCIWEVAGTVRSEVVRIRIWTVVRPVGQATQSARHGTLSEIDSLLERVRRCGLLRGT